MKFFLYYLSIFSLLGVIFSLDLCFLYTSTDKTLCLSCQFNSYINLTVFDPNFAFLSTLCTYSNTKIIYQEKVYIMNNNSYDCSNCNGAINNPYNNIVSAFIQTWKKALPYFQHNLTFYLIGSSHYINKYDWGVSEKVYMFRRAYSNITIIPLLCSEYNITGCYSTNSIKPVIYFKTDQFYFFISLNMTIINIVFDGSDILMGDLTTNETKYYKLCNFTYLNQTYDSNSIDPLMNCSLRNRAFNSSNDSYGLFNLEPRLEVLNLNVSSINIRDCEFINFNSFASMSNGYISLISATAWTHQVYVNRTLFNYIYLASGIYNTKTYDSYYVSLFPNEYQLTDKLWYNDNTTKRTIIYFENNIIKNYNYFHVTEKTYPMSLNALFSSQKNQISLTFISNIFVNNFHYLNNEAAVLKFYNPYAIKGSKYFFMDYLNMSSNYFDCNYFSYIIYFETNYTRTNYNLLIFNSSGNFYTRNGNNYIYLVKTIYYSINDHFENMFFVKNFMILNKTDVYILNEIFMNFDCPLNNPIDNLQDDTGNDDYDSPLFMSYLSQSSQIYEQAFSNYKSNQSYSENVFLINSSNFINFNCSLYIYNQELIRNMIIINSSFTNIYINNSDFMGFAVEENFQLNHSLFQNIQANILFNMPYGRNFTINTINFININSSIFKTTLRVISPMNNIKFCLNSTNFMNISSSNDLFLQDGYDISSAYVGVFINLQFINIQSTTDNSIKVFSFYMELATLINITFFNMNLVQCLNYLSPSQSFAYANPTSFLCQNCSFYISNPNFLVSLFIDVEDFSTINIKSTNFSSNDNKNQDPAFVSLSTSMYQITLQNCIFNNLIGSKISSLNIKTNYITNILIINCTFHANYADLFSDIYFTISSKVLNFQNFIQQSLLQNHLIPNITLNENFCSLSEKSIGCFNSSMITSSNQGLFGMFNNYFHNITGKTGACITLSQNSQFFMTNNTFFMINTYDSGSIIYASPQTEIYLFKNYFQNLFASVSGGILYGKNCDFFMESSEICSAEASRGGLIYSSVANITILNVTIDLVYANIGGALYITESKLIMNTVDITNGSAFIGGHIYSNKGSIYLNKIKFIGGHADFEGASLYLETISSFNIKNVTISNCDIVNKAIIYVSGMSNSKGNFSEFECSNNTAKYSCLFIKNGNININCSSFLNLRGSQSIRAESVLNQGILSFNSCYFYNIQTSQTIISLEGFNFVISYSLFYSLIECKIDIIQLVLTNITINYCEFDIYNNYSFSSKMTNYIQCSASSAVVMNSFFYGRKAVSAIYFVNSFNLNFYNVIFFETYSNLNGAAMSVFSSISLELINSLIFLNEAFNYAALFIEDTNTQINTTYFIECSSLISSAIYFTIEIDTNLKNISITESNFQNNGKFAISIKYAMSVLMKSINYNITQPYIYSLENGFCDFVMVNNIKFENITVFGNYIKSSIEISNDGNIITNINLNNSYFSNSFTLYNGAVFNIIGITYFNISNTIFKNNSALQNGGVIYFSCGVENKCSLQAYHTQFYNNSALMSGGAIKIIQKMNFFLDSNTIFINNSAVFGSDYSSIPTYSLIFDSNINVTSLKLFEKNINMSKYLNITQYYFSSVISGSPMSISIVIFDSFCNFMSLEQESSVEFSSNSYQNDSPIKLQAFNNIINVNDGFALFSNIKFIGRPGTSYFVNLVYQSIISENNYTQTLAIPLRLCKRGEEYVNFQCIYCKKKTYLLHNYSFQDESDQFFCETCESSATCLGYDSMIPNFGYWRYDENTKFIAQCKIDVACPIQIEMLSYGNFENNYQNFTYEYRCSQGYSGNLCSRCERYFGKNSDQECVKCKESSLLFVRFLLICMILILFLITQSLTALSFNEENNNSKNRSFLKIIVDHFSFVSFIFRFNIDWGTVISQYFEISDKFITTAPEEIFNFNCFLVLSIEDQELIELLNLILISLSPFFFIFIILILLYFFQFLAIYLKKKYKKNQDKQFIHLNFKKNFISVFLIVFYNFYPRLILSGFFLFKCITINDTTDTYLEQNPDFRCWDPKHLTLILFIALPNILIWGLGIPIILSAMALKFKTMMEMTEKYEYWKEVYQYLTFDYHDNKYYWETFLFLQKLIVVGISIFISRFDAASQGGIMILLFLLFFLIYEASSPCKYDFVNKYRIYSYMTTISTAAFAILSSNQSNNSFMKVLYLSCLLGVNSLFYFGWIFNFLKLQYKIFKNKKTVFSRILNKIFATKRKIISKKTKNYQTKKTNLITSLQFA